MQRDLARQRRDGEASASTRRLDKTDGETAAWLRAKLEMETDDYLDALADNPTGTRATPLKNFLIAAFSFFLFTFFFLLLLLYVAVSRFDAFSLFFLASGAQVLGYPSVLSKLQGDVYIKKKVCRACKCFHLACL